MQNFPVFLNLFVYICGKKYIKKYSPLINLIGNIEENNVLFLLLIVIENKLNIRKIFFLIKIENSCNYIFYSFKCEIQKFIILIILNIITTRIDREKSILQHYLYNVYCDYKI